MSGVSLMKNGDLLLFSVPNRIHITLLAMDEPLYRVNGGLGFSISAEDMNLEASLIYGASRVEDLSCDDNCSRFGEIEELLSSIGKLMRLEKGVHIRIMSRPQLHVGLGSGASLKLAAIESLLLLNDHEYTPELIVRLSRRGGTSGIGITTYFEGGFVVDLGHKDFTLSHAPSSENQASVESLPLNLLGHPMPDWPIGICYLKNAEVFYGAREKRLFETTCPIPRGDVQETLYHSIFGVVGSVLDGCIEDFKESINSIQNIGWKKSELEFREDARFIEFMGFVRDLTGCAGMSSLGPVIYFTYEDWDTIVSSILGRYPDAVVVKAKANNSGRKLSYA